jgi:ADP-heptose:LPS heptosyltransferase
VSVLEQLAPGARVGVVRLRSLGDCVLTTPALAILKTARPDLEVAVVVEDRFAAVFDGIAETLAPGKLRRWHPELCLNLHGGTRSMRMTAVSGARFRAGFAHHRYSSIYNVLIPTAQEILGVERKVHTAEHLASAMFFLGVPPGEIPPARLTAAEPAADPGRYAVLHALASTSRKTWPAERFRDIAEQLVDARIQPVFIAGPREDVTGFRAFNTVVGAPLSEVKTLISRASLFVGNDSGPAHMAAAFGVRSVVIFADSDPEIWGPWKSPAQVLLARDGMAQLKVEDVMNAIARLKVAA